MPRLRFYARPEHVLAWPGQNMVGQVRRYVGREHKITRNSNQDVEQIAHPAKKEPVEIDESHPAFKRVVKSMRLEQSLIPADKATADFFSLPFVEHEWVEGEWQPKKAKKTTPNEGGSS